VIGACVVVAMVHSLAIGHYYFVGSFDDDANYILTARALLHGQGLTGHLVSGVPVVSAYPPGYPLLLVPFEWLSPSSFVPIQVFSALCYAAVFPLTWVYLKKRRMPDSVVVGVMVLMALNEVMATFGAMVMAEMPYLVCFLLFLLAIDRWEATRKVATPTGLAVVLLGAELVWLKEAGLGLVLGVGLWFLLRRRVAKAVAVVGGFGVSLVPFLVARVLAGVPLAGGRYTSQLDRYYAGNLVTRVLSVLPGAAWHWLTVALPATVVESGQPLPSSGIWSAVISVVVVQVTVFTLVGFVIAVRSYRDVAVVAIPAYVAETLLWPQINERRVILALPVILAWYALGVRWAVLGTWRFARRHWPARQAPRRSALGAWSLLGVVVLVVPMLLQFPRDYLFGLGQPSSRPQGSRYMEILAALQPHSEVVETDYLNTTALFSGHRTAETAMRDAYGSGATCTSARALAGIATDHAGLLLDGALNKPWEADSPCLYRLATTEPWAVRLLRSTRDKASVFELIGPGTAHPDLVDLTASEPTAPGGEVGFLPVAPLVAGDQGGLEPVTPAVDGQGVLTWSFPAVEQLAQVSVGEAGQVAGLADGVSVQVLLPDGTWYTLARAARGVGAAPGDAPFLLDQLATPIDASALRVVVSGQGPVYALDVAALAETGGHG